MNAHHECEAGDGLDDQSLKSPAVAGPFLFVVLVFAFFQEAGVGEGAEMYQRRRLALALDLQRLRLAVLVFLDRNAGGS